MLWIVNKRVAALFVLCLAAALAAAVPVQAAHLDGKKPHHAKSQKVKLVRSDTGCQVNTGPDAAHPWLNVATCTVATSVPTRLTLGTSTDTSYALQTRDLHYRKVHTVTIRGLGVATTYNWNATVQPKHGAAKTFRGGTFTTSTAGGPVNPTISAGRILLNGVPAFIFGWNAPGRCFKPAAVNSALKDLEVNIVWYNNSTCSNPGDVNTAWFVTSMGDLPCCSDSIEQQPNFLGWDGGSDPEASARADQLPAPPKDGKFSSFTFRKMFWNGQDPGWYGDGQAPSWNSATVKSFLAHAPVDMFGIMQYPFSGSCSPADLGQVFEGTKLLGSIGRKPILSWIDLVTASAAPSCHAKNLTASQASSQIFAAVESGAQGVVFSTLNTDSGTSVPPVAASSAANSTSRLRTLLPCLLTGKNVPVKVSSTNVVARACRYGGQVYLMATNTSDKLVKTALRVGTKAGTAVVLWEGRSIKMPKNGISDKFQPLQTHIYQVRFGH